MKDTKDKIIDLVNKAIPVQLIQKNLGCSFKEVMEVINEVGGKNLPKTNKTKYVNIRRKINTSSKRRKAAIG